MYNPLFSDIFKGPVLESATEEKAALLQNRTAEKMQRLDPYHAQTQELLGKVTEFESTLKSRLASTQQAETQRVAESTAGTQKIADMYDPESEQNQGQWFTDGRVHDDGLLSVAGAANLAAGVKKGAGDVAGMAAASIPNNLFFQEMSIVDPEAVEVYSKLKKSEQLKSSLDQNLKQMKGLVDVGRMSQNEYMLHVAEAQQQINANQLTDDEQAILNAVPKDAAHDGYTNQEIIARAEKFRATGKAIPKAIDTAIGGTKHFSSYESDQLSDTIADHIKDDVTQLNAAKDNINDGEYLEAAKKGFPALARVIYSGLAEGIKNPHGAAQAISEEFLDIALAKMGPIGLAGSAAESFGFAAQMKAEGLEKFIEEHGRKPSMEEFDKIEGWSTAVGALDMAADLTISGAGKGLKTGIAKAANMIKEPVEEAAEAVSKGLARRSIEGVLSGAGTLTKNATVEGLTEGAQEVIDDYTSELKPVGDLSKAALSTAVGALVGGGMPIAATATDATAKIVGTTGAVLGATAVAAGKGITGVAKDATTPKSEERIKAETVTQGVKEHGYEDKVKAAVEAKDVSAYTDPTSDDYRPSVALDALARMNQDENTTYEEKAQNLEKAIQVFQDFNVARYKRQNKLEELEQKKKDGKLTDEAEQAELVNLKAITQSDNKYIDTLRTRLASMTKTDVTVGEARQKLADAKIAENPDEADAILKQVFGSNGGADLQSFGSSLEAIKQNPQTKPATKKLVESIQAFTTAKSKLGSAVTGKSTGEVHEDVITGGTGFRGVNSYVKTIAQALAAGNEKVAQEEFTKLSAFAQDRRLKHTTFANVHNALAEGKEPSPEDQKNLDYFSAKRASGPYYPKPGNPGWDNMVDTIHLEADAVEKGVQMASDLFGSYQKNPPAVETAQAPAERQTVQQVPKAKPQSKKQPEVKPVAQKTEKLSHDEIHARNMAKTYDDLDADKLRELAKSYKEKAKQWQKSQPVIYQQKLAEATRMEQLADEREAAAKIEVKAAESAEPTVQETGSTTQVQPVQQETKVEPIAQETMEEKPEQSVQQTENKQEQTQQDLLTYSDNLPKWVSGIAQQWIDLLKLNNSSIHITTLADAKADTHLSKVFPQLSYAISKQENSATNYGYMVSGKDGKRLILLKDTSNKARTLDTLAHELGHILEIESFNNADKTLKDQILEEYNKWLNTKHRDLKAFYASKKAIVSSMDIADLIDQHYGDTTRKFEDLSKEDQEMLLRFSEWFADQVARWATSTDKPLTAVDQFFKQIADLLRKLYATALGKVHLPNSKMQVYLDGLSATIKENNSITDAESNVVNKNMVTAFLSAKKDAVADVINNSNMFQVLQDAVANNGLVKLLQDKNYIPHEADNTLVTSMTNFGKVFTQAAQDNLKAFGATATHLTYFDAIQDMLTDGKINPTITNAMSAAVYKWIATRANETLYNDDEAILGLLGLGNLKPEDIVYNSNIIHLREVGVSQNFMVEALGAEIYRLTGLTGKPGSPVDYEQRVKDALGLYAVATLEKLGYLTVNRVYTDALTAIKEDILDTESFGELQLSAKEIIKQGNTDTKTIAYFYRVTNSKQRDAYNRLQMHENIVPVVEKWKAANRVWDALFTQDPEDKIYSFDKPEKPKDGRLNITNSTQKATAEQTDNLFTNMVKGWKLNSAFAPLFMLLTPEQQMQMQGYTDPMEEHVSRRDATESANKKIQRDIASLYSWMQDALQNTTKGRQSHFFIPNQFISNTRMMQQGPINPQGVKLHRYFFQMPKWTQTIDLNNQDHMDKFMEGIGLALDIEVLKKGGFDEAKQQIEAKLNTPEIQAAVASLREIMPRLSQYDLLNPEAQAQAQEDLQEHIQNILTGVAAGEKNAGSLKGLMEYAAYLDALDQQAVDPKRHTFESTLTTELDGTGNGPVIGRIQMLINRTWQAMAVLRSGGFSTSDTQTDLGKFLKHAANLDTYQITGMVWGEALERHINDIIASTDKFNHSDNLLALKRITAAKALFGEFNDEEGFVNKVVRDLTKKPTTVTIYGSGDKAIDKKLTKTLIDNHIVKSLKKIANIADGKTAEYELQQLINNVNIVANVDPIKQKFVAIQMPKNVVNPDGSTNKQAVLEVTLPKKLFSKLNEYTVNHHGKALHEAIRSVYGDMMEGRKPFNTSFGVVAAIYNVAYKHEVDKRIEERKKDGTLPVVSVKRQKGKPDTPIYGDLSKEDYKGIKEKIDKLFPRLKTPFGGYIDMAKESRRKVYTNEDEDNVNAEYDVVKQSYAGTPQKIHHIYRKGGVESPGVSPVVLGIQMHDATVSNKIQGSGLDVLNNHDGFYVPVLQAEQLNQVANQAFHDTIRDYDFLQTMHDSIKESLDNFQAYMAENGLKADAWDATIVKELHKFKTKSITDGFDHEGKPKYINITPKSYRFVVSTLLRQMQANAKIANKNKQIVFKYLKKLNQYYYYTGGLTVSEDTVDDTVQTAFDTLDQRTEETNTQRAEDLKTLRDTNAEQIKALYEEYAFQSSAETVSVDEAEYDLPNQINGQNVVDTYDQVKDLGSVQVSPEHDSKLKRLLHSLVSNVMNPVDMYLKMDATKETAGRFTTENKMFISSQAFSGVLAQGMQMSTGEVYVHELVHAITHHGLKMNARLRGQVQMLYDMVKAELDANGEGYTIFLSNPTINVNDPLNKAEVDAAKARWDYLFNKPAVHTVVKRNTATDMDMTKKYLQHLDEFMAYGLTNERFAQRLAQISTQSYKGKLFDKAAWAGIKGNNIQETMVNLLNRIMDMIMHNFTSSKPAANIAQELEALAYRLATIDSKNKTTAWVALSKFDKHYQKSATFMNKYIKKAFGKLNLQPLAHDLAQRVANQNSPTGQFVRGIQQKYDELDYGFFQATWTEIRGLTPRLETLHKLFNFRGILIDQAREAATAAYKTAVNKLWQRELTVDEKKAWTKAGLKVDLQALRMHFKMEDIRDMVNPDNAPAGQITALDRAIADIQRRLIRDQGLQPYSNYFMKQAQSLGMFMAHGYTLEADTPLNARIIAEMLDTKYEGMLSDNEQNKAEELIEQLATMFALKFTDGNHRRTLHNLMVEDLQASEAVLQIHADILLQAQNSMFNDNPYKMIKGYTKEIINPEISLRIGTLADEAAMNAEGYTRSEHPLPKDLNDTFSGQVYLYTARNGQSKDLLSTIASFTGNSAKGTDMMDLMAATGRPLRLAHKYNQVLTGRKTALRDAMFQGPMVPYSQNNRYPTYMIPQVDDAGFATKYRYVMSESVKDGLLEKYNHYDDILGAMAGQVPDKKGTAIINERLVHALKDLYDAEYNDRFRAYVEISPYAAEQRYRDIYHMLPAQAKKQIETVWGSNKMFVAKDVIDLAFGTRKYSLIETFGKDPQTRNFLEKALVHFAQQFFGDKKVTRVKQVEDVLRSLTKMAKNNIVVKSFLVSWNNHVSNLLFCKGRGVSYSNILKWKREATVGALKYQADKKALDDVRIQLNRAKDKKTIDKLQSKIQVLENEIALNPVTDLMDSGLMQSIVDDVETSNTQSPFPSLLDQTLDKMAARLPSQVNKVGKVLFLTEDTQAYKVLNNAVKMTDFIGRYIMYQHYTHADRGNQKLSHEQAVAQVIHEFVNFNLPSHRMVEYLNSVGLLWFTKYSLRVLKPIKDMVQDKPFEAISAFALGHTLGLSNVSEAIPFVYKNPLSVFSDPLSAFVRASDDAVTLQAAESLYEAMTP